MSSEEPVIDLAGAAEGRKVIKAALATAVEKAAEKKAAKKSARVPRQPAAPAAALASAGTATAWKEAGHNLRTLSVAMIKAPVPEGREAAARDALAALQEACEAFAVFLK
mgnify:CR=1 FL=1